ncbi:MAG: M1 family metallopeptidase [Ferruginibacter sp.]
MRIEGIRIKVPPLGGQGVLFFLLFSSSSFCQGNYWQQKVNYKIDVSLNDTAKTLDGYIIMQYYNNSPDTLKFIWFHVWPNAYKNDHTAFSDQLIENGRKDFYFSNDDKRGYINRLDFKVDKTTALIEDHPQHQDIIKLILPKPLAPGATTTIETPFHVKLPYNFSRGGYINKSFQVTQWYPKPAVYDKKGWHEMPYLDQGEFYSEFGEYNVQITVPKDYVVAATGKVKSEDDNGATKTFHYLQDNIHDFAWFADKDFSVLHDTLQLGTRSIDVYSYFNKKNNEGWKNSIGLTKAAIKTKSEWVGEYPYDIVSVVERPGKNDAGGMEYPTITLVSYPGNEKGLDEVINHEVGHNWFYGILASNERQHPWMDEGMNTFYDERYLYEKYQKGSMEVVDIKSSFIKKRIPDDFLDLGLRTMVALKKDQPIEMPAENFTLINYGTDVYYKTGQWMNTLEMQLGKSLFDSVMHVYYKQWGFKHPYPEDFKLVAESVSGKNLDSVFSLLNSKDYIKVYRTQKLHEDPFRKKKIKFTAFFNLKETDKYNYVAFSPAIGYNFYDKFMIGALIHNYSLPLPKFQFILAPLYGTSSKEFNGIGRLGYNWYGNNGRKIELAVSGAKFTVDQFTDSTGKKNNQPFYKIVPSLKYVFANKRPRSTVTKYIQWKTFFINETGLLFKTDPVTQEDVISYPTANRYVNQLQFVIENNRVLYPYKGALQAEQGKGFIRLNFTGNYFFDYANGGGLNLRFFAGKFIYTGDKTFLTQYETDAYHLNLSGPKGYEDYTYSNYFVGRNEFEGFSNQQIMNRDGAFKVRTDLLGDKIGKTDDWLSALNFTTSIPNKVNPLSVLPIKIPLRIFFDIGTYSEAWKNDAGTGRFLYDAGFQLSFFKNVLNIYFPVLYSKVYRDYFKSTITENRFKKNITFSIDIQNISLKKLFPQISL